VPLAPPRVTQPPAQPVHRTIAPPASPPPAAAPAYRQRDNFLTPAEAAFFATLREATANDWLIMSKVRLADLVDAPNGREWQAAWNKISRKHVDFVLCDPATVRPRLVLELDDRSHRRPDRVERDAFVDRVFADAAMPILHVPVRRHYDAAALRAQIAALLPAEAAAQPAELSCARCGAPMCQRVAKRGERAGEQFWGCTNYPRCRHIVPIAA
jgi:hypothetical protein